MGVLNRVRVKASTGAYDVVLARGLEGIGRAVAEVVPADRAFVVTDANVGPLWAEALLAELEQVYGEVGLITVPAGEGAKSLEVWARVLDQLLAGGVHRKAPVFALGGGVVGDLAGFAAASVLRGVPFVQVPTTVLAMVDSSVGGKTGLNHPAGKNLVGAFHAPRLVWAAMDTLSTLPPRQVRAGLGEVLKAGLIADAGLFDLVERRSGELAALHPEALVTAITASIAVKAKVVEEDEREGGRRAILNAGHTLGHGLEAALGYGAMAHGEAVGWGLWLEARWAEEQGLCEEDGLAERIRRVCVALGYPAIPSNLPDDDFWHAVSLDKKVQGTILRLPVVRRIGHCVLHSIPVSTIQSLWKVP